MKKIPRFHGITSILPITSFAVLAVYVILNMFCLEHKIMSICNLWNFNNVSYNTGLLT